ncbi:MAG: HAD family hydrolase [Bacteroidetes bacterium]|nr:HAD family hydrolase [Bacteroidota bacterium]
MSEKINMWSGPRNISTALMYSFAQRTDTLVVDEPLYAFYLHTTGLQHPGCEEVLKSQSTDGNQVVDQILHPASDKPYVIFKQMSHHLLHLDLSFLLSCKNFLLLRHPARVINSYIKNIANVSEDDLGFNSLVKIFDYLKENKQPLITIDSDTLIKNPEQALTILCNKLQIPFDKNMLHWKAGTRPEDGVWAKHWYENVHQSTGLHYAETPIPKLEKKYVPLLEKCLHDYYLLKSNAIEI